jgi:hypothetical protein
VRSQNEVQPVMLLERVPQAMAVGPVGGRSRNLHV